uniref:Uncharacterized protein n=1 Tax=Bos indicus x Bos taurus TaxID=30522 RepID=A0A4W2GYX9_BOBOX
METTAAAAPAWGFFSSFLLLAFRTLVAALLGAAHRLGLFYQLMHKDTLPDNPILGRWRELCGHSCLPGAAPWALVLA